MKTAQERNLLAQAAELGLTVRFHYMRPRQVIHPGRFGEYLSSQPATKGGTTVCNLCRQSGENLDGTPQYEVIVTGVAKCNERDTFSKGIGRAIAIGRAMQSFKEKKTA